MNPVYHQAKFINSAPLLKNAPPDEGMEVAFAGRSNAGKSSAINSLTRQQGLARISKTPGRTQMLNFFAINDKQRFVDLPGYGYAKVPAAVKKKWHDLMESYLTQRKSLCAIVLVMDIRHPMTEFDWQMIEWSKHTGLPLHILLTKSDKLSHGAAKNILMQVRKELAGVSFPLTVQLFSSLKKDGIEEVHDALDRLFKNAGKESKADINAFPGDN
jgi:GTP-binding protein